jgi:hypothetical protein
MWSIYSSLNATLAASERRHEVERRCASVNETHRRILDYCAAALAECVRLESESRRAVEEEHGEFVLEMRGQMFEEREIIRAANARVRLQSLELREADMDRRLQEERRKFFLLQQRELEMKRRFQNMLCQPILKAESSASMALSIDLSTPIHERFLRAHSAAFEIIQSKISNTF